LRCNENLPTLRQFNALVPRVVTPTQKFMQNYMMKTID
jgi:hypothetical protein